MRRMMCLILICACVASWALPAHAARVRRLTLTQLRDRATSIIVGRVHATTVRPGSGGKMVWTDYDIAVEQTLLGVPGSQLGALTTISFAGGQHGMHRAGILGVPTLETGKRYILFLLPKAHYPSATVGWAQGIYSLTEIETGAARRTVLISHEGQPLELDTTGALFRGSPVAVSGLGLRALVMQQTHFDASRKESEPAIVDASGQPIPQRPSSLDTSAVPIANRKFADVDHLKRFLEGELQESLTSGR